MQEIKKPKSPLRRKADGIKYFRCKNLVAVIEHPVNIMNIGSVVRNVDALGVEKVYIITDTELLPNAWEDMRNQSKLNSVSASAIKWTFIKIFKDTNSCINHLEKNGFISAVTSPNVKGRNNVVLHAHDYTQYKKLAVWFGNERIGISDTAVERSSFCINIPMYGIIESLNLGTSSGIVFYEITKQRRQFQFELHKKISSSLS